MKRVRRGAEPLLAVAIACAGLAACAAAPNVGKVTLQPATASAPHAEVGITLGAPGSKPHLHLRFFTAPPAAASRPCRRSGTTRSSRCRPRAR